MLIVLSGLPGTGKSELGGRLGRALGIPVFSVDPIEAAILRAGVPRSFETGLGAYLVAEALVDTQLALGGGAIADAVNAVEPAKEMWRAQSRKHGVALRVISCLCSDEALHRRRLEERARDLGAIPEPTWADIHERRRETVPWTEPTLSIDSVESPEENLARALAWLDRA